MYNGRSQAIRPFGITLGKSDNEPLSQCRYAVDELPSRMAAIRMNKRF
jgi:hypothetical protein